MLRHKGTVTLESERLVLRQFLVSDAEDMYNNWATDAEVTKYLTWDPHESVDMTRDILTSWVETYERLESYQWAMVIKDTNKLVGSIGLVKHSNINEYCEVGYCCSRSVWGQGYMTEALKTINDFLFFQVGFERISAIHYAENTASGRVMQKVGMKHEGTKRHFYKKAEGVFIDCESYAVIKSDLR